MNTNLKPSALPGRSRGWIAGGALVSVLLLVGLVFTASGRDAAPSGSETEPRGEMAALPRGGMDMSMGGSVRLTADQVRQFGITFGSAEQRPLESEVRTVGIVNFDETRMAQVTPKFGGYIERLYVDFTGQRVRRGEPLIEIYSPELVAAQEELLLAARLDANLEESTVPGVSGRAADLAQVARRRLRLWDISDAQIDQILETGRVRRTLTLQAPVAGVVVEKQVLQGQAVQAGQTLYTIADLSEVWVEAELREADAGSVQEGSSAVVELAAFPGRPIPGRVEYVYPTIQEQSRTLKARIAVPNPEGRIKPGMYATVRLTAPTRTALTVPSPAVVYTGERQVVFVDMGDGSLMPHEVEVGRVAGAFTEILSGVQPGQRVVTSAQYILDSESNMAEVMRSMMGQMGTGDMGGMEGMEMSGRPSAEMNMKGADVQGMPGMDMPREER